MAPKGVSPPFALFAVVNLEKQVINKILQKAKSATSVNDLWLVSSSDYSDTPQKVPKKVNTGTDPPIPSTFQSPFINHKLSDLVQWLRSKPKNVDLDEHYFVILDAKAEGPGEESVVVCSVERPHERPVERIFEFLDGGCSSQVRGKAMPHGTR
ncbi:uncharacterized protein MYCFIDRAFT_214540 [Pseudocercospora fijiensis CIRAD86]|uniref:Uncharacterized protein n=1 Tax=Pseudocercospora fijiensis (strain CIRAD86) TaxID=383855 RepID=M3AH58_PSEFD|nr:uncharacterized protein MYCFIDRAFT_214540 [Pseudocercospora fijiensis CIRAD86]EME83906.1 hypothetical protein MYCFIDRAFT_214540 [Pseudocercospora fijiensis CIRAD86]